jgi:hypothetical protein
MDASDDETAWALAMPQNGDRRSAGKNAEKKRRKIKLSIRLL